MPYVIRKKGTEQYYLTGKASLYGDLQGAEVYNEPDEAMLDVDPQDEEVVEVSLAFVRVVPFVQPGMGDVQK